MNQAIKPKQRQNLNLSPGDIIKPARAHTSTSTWTPARRKQAADRIRTRKPWLTSTGPKTLAGKSVSKMNAYKHGMRSAEVLARRRALVHFLREQKEFLRAVKTIIKLRKALKKANAANEVIDLFPKISYNARIMRKTWRLCALAVH